MKYLLTLLALASIPAFAERKNSIRVHVGAAPLGLNTKLISPNTRQISQDYQPVIGVGYERNLTGAIIGLTFLSNKTVLISLGDSF